MASALPALTPVEQRVMDFINAEASVPTLRRIAELMEWAAHSRAAAVVKNLKRKGRLRRYGRRPLKVVNLHVTEAA